MAVTGATGFIGRRLCANLAEFGHSVTAITRSAGARSCLNDCNTVVVGDMANVPDWKDSLIGIDCVVHLAARVHVMKDDAISPLEEFIRVNVDGTRQLAEAAASAGVRRFIFMSSIKVLGESTGQSPFDGSEQPQPVDPYSISKLRAEHALREIEGATKMEVVVIRPPLVHGPGVGGNLLRLLHLVRRQVPLPFGGIRNARSMVGIQNLCDLIQICIDHDRAPGNAFLVSDNQDVSTPDLIRLMGSCLGVPVRLFRVPTFAIELVARCLGKDAEIRRLSDSLVVNCDRTMEVLDWVPQVSLETGISAVCADFLESQR